MGLQLHGAMIGSDQPQVLGGFYTKLFGAPEWQDGEWTGFDIGGGTLMIGPHSEVKGQSSMPGRMMFVLETDDLKGESERLKKQGAVVVAEPYQPDAANSPDMWVATFADPDTNYFQLSTPWK